MPLDNGKHTIIGQTPNIGDSARYIFNNGSVDQTMSFGGYGDFDVSTFGTVGGRGVSSQHSWQYAIDSSQPNAWAGEEFTVAFSYKHTQSATGGLILFHWYSLKLDIINSEVQIKDVTDTRHGTGLVMLPQNYYMIVVRRVDVSGVKTFEVEMERLDTGTSSTGSTPVGLDPTQTSGWYISQASQHFLAKSGVLGPVIAFDGIDAASVTTAKQWLRKHYSGSTESGNSGGSGGSGESGSSGSTTQTVYQLYDSTVRTVPLYTPHRTVKDITLEFRDQTNTLVDPTDMCLNIEL